MTLGSLFAGIGGFELAAIWAGIEPVWSNEIDPFCCRVLRKNFNHEIIEKDIREIGGGDEFRPVDIISGGFECQPFSIAGLRKGKEDVRYYWLEMYRIIKELFPLWVVAENVYGILNIDNHYTIESICSDLEDIGYEKPIIFDCKADFTGIPTMERHIWIISKAIEERCERGKKNTNTNKRNKRQFQRTNSRINRGWDISETKFCRVGERVSARLDEYQRDRIKSLGNAIVPQVAYEIFKAIIEYDNH